MEEEKEITHRLWHGYIPIELTLAPADAVELLASPTLPEPFQTFYILAPRESYLPFLTKKIKEQWLEPLLTLGTLSHSSSSGINRELVNERDFWMEVEGVPLKWHYPIGLLYDIHVNAVKKAQKLVRTMDEGYRDSPRSTNSHSPPLSGEESVTIPWSVTLHLRKFPSDKLIRSPTSQTMRDMHMAMVKEADYIRHGSTKRVMDLSKDDQTQLLDGLESHSFEQYHAIQTFLSSPTSTVSHNSSNNGLPRNIPIRWHIFPKGSFQPDHAIILQDLIPPTSPQSPANMPRVNIKPVSSPMLKKPPNGAWLTLLDGFKQVYPEVFLPQTKETTESPTTSKETKGTDPQSTSVVSRWECWTQGIQPPWDAPLIWLSSNLSYLDGFLHIVLVETK